MTRVERRRVCEHVFVSWKPVILHADVDAFYASVEQRDDPGLQGRPVVVGAGVVMAASYEARAFGVRGGMSGGRARRLCPQAIVATPRWAAYVEASKAVFAVFAQTAPLVEGLSIEEAFLDVSGAAGSPRDIAVRLRAEVREQVGLPITVGVARTKIVAKMASRAAKPDGLLVVAPDAERAFLHPLRVEQLWGVGPATAKKLHDRDLRTVGQLAGLTEAALMSILGKASGRHVHALVQNRDRGPVQANRPPRSFGAQRALGRSAALPAPEVLDAAICGLVDRVVDRMLPSGHAARTVLLRLRFDDFSRATRSHTLPAAAAAGPPILAAARMLLAAAMPMIERRGLTLVGVTVANLADVSGQMELELGQVPPAHGTKRPVRGRHDDEQRHA
jgi:DNA polymerase-4